MTSSNQLVSVQKNNVKFREKIREKIKEKLGKKLREKIIPHATYLLSQISVCNKREMNKKSEIVDDYEKCDHEYTIKSLGFKICVTCGLCLKQYFSQETNYNLDRVFLKNTGQTTS